LPFMLFMFVCCKWSKIIIQNQQKKISDRPGKKNKKTSKQKKKL